MSSNMDNTDPTVQGNKLATLLGDLLVVNTIRDASKLTDLQVFKNERKKGETTI